MLHALPDDIRINIEEVLRVKCGYKETSDNTTSDRVDVDETGRCQRTDLCFVDDDAQPGCSHWTSDDGCGSATSASVKCPTSLPSYSQVICTAR